ncbi:MAG: hypothetical protein K9G31_01960 [Crocinitomicaceae bacterium]|nr:hypothetical protein [Crocinitomicaceae bacterium]MCF8443710.1 hypothetical protein [Crocinitomicaceae bacterium]
MIQIINNENYQNICINNNIDGVALKKLMIKNNIFSLSVEGNVENLDFLFEVKDIIKKLIIENIAKVDNTIIESLINLEFLGLKTIGKHIISFKNLRKLQYLYLEFDKKINNIDVLNELERLTLYKWKKNQWNLILPNFLKRLEIVSNHFESLTFIENNQYEELGLYYMPKLITLNGIFENKKLKKIHLKSCKRFKTYEELLNFPELEELIIEDCGVIDSIQSLKILPKLKSLRIIGNNDLMDKETEFIEELNYYFVCGKQGGMNFTKNF